MKTRDHENDHVLVRCPEFKPSFKKWMAASYERKEISNGKSKYLCSGTWWLECVSYQFNEELLGTTLNPKEISSMKWGEKCLAWHDEDGWREGVFISFNEKDIHRPWMVVLKPQSDSKDEFEVYRASTIKLASQEEQ